MVKTDRIVALAIIGISLFLFTKTGKFLEEGSGENISAAFFPRFIIFALIACSAWLAIKSTMKPVSFPAPKGVAIGIALIVGYVFLIKPLGYFIVTPLFLFFLPFSLGYRKWGWLVAMTFTGTVFAYVVFFKVLSVPLPMGILENIGGFL